MALEEILEAPDAGRLNERVLQVLVGPGNPAQLSAAKRKRATVQDIEVVEDDVQYLCWQIQEPRRSTHSFVLGWRVVIKHLWRVNSTSKMRIPWIHHLRKLLFVEMLGTFSPCSGDARLVCSPKLRSRMAVVACSSRQWCQVGQPW